MTAPFSPTIEDEIEHWSKAAYATAKRDLALVAIGVATGLKIARNHYVDAASFKERSDV